MKIQIEQVKVKKRVLFESFELPLTKTGVYLIKGFNGLGKTLLLSNIHSKLSNSAYCHQDNNILVEQLSIKEHIDNILSLEEKNLFLKHWYSITSKDINTKVSTLSGGHKRIFVVLLFLNLDKNIILIEKPFNDLDYKKKRIIQEIIDEYSKIKLLIIVYHEDIFFYYLPFLLF